MAVRIACNGQSCRMRVAISNRGCEGLVNTSQQTAQEAVHEVRTHDFGNLIFALYRTCNVYVDGDIHFLRL